MKYLIGIMFAFLLIGLWRPPQLRRPWIVLALVLVFVGFFYLHPTHL